MDLTHVTAFESRQMTHAIRIDRLNGVHLAAELPKGWEGHFELDRGNSAADDLINSLEQIWPGIDRLVSYPRFASTTPLSRWELSMIDAHEIGIQLALQDGVSAGLRVITQELGTLDRAVAATAAAGLLEGMTAMAMTAVAQGAARVAAAAEGIRVPTVAEPAALAAEPAVAGAFVPTQALAPERAVAARGEDFARPEVTPAAARVVATPGPAAPAGAMTAAMAAPIAVLPGVAAPEIAAPVATPVASAVIAMLLPKPGVVGSAAAPVRAAPIMPQVVPQSVADVVPAAPVRVPLAEPARWAATDISAAPVTPSGVAKMQAAAPMARVAPIMETPRVVPVAPMTPDAPISAMEPIRTMERGMRQTPAAPLARVAAVPAAAQAPAAPIAGRLGGQAAMPGHELLPGRPAVPPAQPQEGGKSGGDVMLDGHLVGHWLAERMGRDAARPSAGMTHFNPRQAAAWTPSGAL